MALETLTTFFGWMTVLNFGLLLMTTIALLIGRERFAAIHADLLGLEPEDVKKAYFAYLANFKIMVFIFCIAPYIALKLM